MPMSMPKLKAKNVSFVVQGPVIPKVTRRTLKSIRAFFPESTIILSTWKKEIVDDLIFDEVVFNNDPGAKFRYLINGETLNNNNRQIVSTQKGLSKVKTVYAVKTRTDVFFESSALLHEMELCFQLKMKFGKDCLYKHLLVPSNLTINPRKSLNLAFHPSDFFIAGTIEDLIDLFDVSLMTKEEMNWFQKCDVPVQACVPDLNSKFSNEQYIFTSFLKKKGIAFKFDNAFDSSVENIKLTEKLFANLFYLRSTRKIGINSSKHPQNFLTKADHIFTECEWNKLYRNYVEPDYPRCIDVEGLKYRLSNTIRLLGKGVLHLLKVRHQLK
jgi:hypothetical protein